MATTAGSPLPNLSGLPREEKLPDGFHIGHHKMIVDHIKSHMRKIEASLDEHMVELERENVHTDATTRAMTRNAREEMERFVSVDYDSDGYPKLEAVKDFTEQVARGTISLGINVGVVAPLSILFYTAIIAFFLLGYVVEGLRLTKQGRWKESHVARNAHRFLQILREETVVLIDEMKKDKIKMAVYMLAPFSLSMLLNQAEMVLEQRLPEIQMLQ
tara:strand:+ start:198 stop:845 length:648 start_codon:yes stop_codon:yes gene_type:complete